MPVDGIPERQLAIAEQVEAPPDDDVGGAGDEVAILVRQAIVKRVERSRILQPCEEPLGRGVSQPAARRGGRGERRRPVGEQCLRLGVRGRRSEPLDQFRRLLLSAICHFSQAHFADSAERHTPARRTRLGGPKRHGEATQRLLLNGILRRLRFHGCGG